MHYIRQMLAVRNKSTATITKRTPFFENPSTQLHIWTPSMISAWFWQAPAENLYILDFVCKINLKSLEQHPVMFGISLFLRRNAPLLNPLQCCILFCLANKKETASRSPFISRDLCNSQEVERTNYHSFFSSS